MKHSRIGHRIPTVGELLAAFENERSGMWKHATRKTFRGAMRRLEPLARARVTELEVAVLWSYVEHERRLERRSATIEQALALLRNACGCLWNERDDGGLQAFAHWTPPAGPAGRNPQKRISTVMCRVRKLFGHDVAERWPFTSAEVPLVAAAAEAVEPDFAPLVRLAAATGMRGCELRALQWPHVDLDRGVLYLRESFSENELGPLKTARWRDVVLPEGALAMLRTLHERRRMLCPFVFERGGHFIRENELSDAMQRVMAEAQSRGVRPGLTLHSFRHTYVSEGRAHLPDAWMQAQVGHSPAMQRRYSHVSVPRNSLAWADFGVTSPDNPAQDAHEGEFEEVSDGTGGDSGAAPGAG